MTPHTLYLAQHGLALDKHDDPDRPLSETGKNNTRLLAKHLGESNPGIERILHSDKTRAIQTADIFESFLKTDSVSTCKQLSPMAEISQILTALKASNTLIIGHLPHLGKLAAYLVTGDERLDIIKFENSAVLSLEKVAERYQISGYISPALLQH